MSKPVLMIHEVKDELFDLPLENYILTFDDGLYSQYAYFDRFKAIATEKIFFISSNILCNGQQSVEFPTCEKAHEKAFLGNKEDYMTLEQVKELMKDPLTSIGAHSHDHTHLNSFPKLFDRCNHITRDTELMIKWFEDNLGFRPTKFCFPYNDDLGGMYAAILGKYGFTEFYGQERIPA